MPLIVTIVLCMVGIIILALVIASLYFYNVAIARQSKEFLNDNPDLTVDPSAELTTFDMTWLDHQTFEKLEIKSYDGLTLRGYYLPASKLTKKTAILAHGYSSRALPDMGSFAQLYHDVFGYNVLLPDDRGHGESEGAYIGFGWHDRFDYLKWIQTAIQKVGEDAQIVLHGLSMGGATVLMTSGEKLPEQVKCIVSDCAYTSVKDILSYQCRRIYKLPPTPFVELTSLICKLRAGYFFGEASALRQIKKAQRPILFIHGTEDTFVPTAMIHQLYDACPTYKEKVLIENAGHALSYATDADSYTNHVANFLRIFT
jgi:fermentation-respiration switch protein FrsA (DUF1100 family)